MIIATIQARTNSTRLPGKVLLKIGKLSVIEHIIFRLSKVKKIDSIRLITTSDESDDQLCAIVSKYSHVSIFRGDENNVLKRINDSLNEFNPKIIVHAFGDNIFLDPQSIDDAISKFISKQYDFGYFSECPTGFGVDMYRPNALKLSYRNANTAEDKEHINSYILNRYKDFNIFKYIPQKIFRKKNTRLTLDNQDDLERILKLNKEFNNKLQNTSVHSVLLKCKALKTETDLQQKYTSKIAYKLKNNLINN